MLNNLHKQTNKQANTQLTHTDKHTSEHTNKQTNKQYNTTTQYNIIGQRSSTALIQLFHILRYTVQGHVMLNNLIQVNTIQYKAAQLSTTQQLSTTRSANAHHQLSSSPIINYHHHQISSCSIMPIILIICFILVIFMPKRF